MTARASTNLDGSRRHASIRHSASLDGILAAPCNAVDSEAGTQSAASYEKHQHSTGASRHSKGRASLSGTSAKGLAGHPVPQRRRAPHLCASFSMREMALLALVVVLSGATCLNALMRTGSNELPSSGDAALLRTRRIAMPHVRRLDAHPDLEADAQRATAGRVRGTLPTDRAAGRGSDQQRQQRAHAAAQDSNNAVQASTAGGAQLAAHAGANGDGGANADGDYDNADTATGADAGSVDADAGAGAGAGHVGAGAETGADADHAVAGAGGGNARVATGGNSTPERHADAAAGDGTDAAAANGGLAGVGQLGNVSDGAETDATVAGATALPSLLATATGSTASGTAQAGNAADQHSESLQHGNGDAEALGGSAVGDGAAGGSPNDTEIHSSDDVSTQAIDDQHDTVGSTQDVVTHQKEEARADRAAANSDGQNTTASVETVRTSGTTDSVQAADAVGAAGAAAGSNSTAVSTSSAAADEVAARVLAEDAAKAARLAASQELSAAKWKRTEPFLKARRRSTCMSVSQPCRNHLTLFICIAL